MKSLSVSLTTRTTTPTTSIRPPSQPEQVDKLLNKQPVPQNKKFALRAKKNKLPLRGKIKIKTSIYKMQAVAPV
jgi:hypothetical protein